MQFRIWHIIGLVVASALACWIGSRVGWHAALPVIAFVLAVILPLIAFALSQVLLIQGGHFAKPILTQTLLAVSLFGWPAVFAGLFLTERRRFQILLISLFIGLVSGVITGGLAHHALRSVPLDEKARLTEGPRSLRLTIILVALVIALAMTTRGITWLFWDVGRLAGLSVAVDQSGWISAEFYGPALSKKAVEQLRDRRLAAGAAERVNVFGFEFNRGFLPYDSMTGRGADSVRRVTFRRTEIGDNVVPILEEFPQLELLDVRETRITVDGVRRLRAALPHCEIRHQATGESD